jgi:hypothetical protein
MSKQLQQWLNNSEQASSRVYGPRHSIILRVYGLDFRQ